MSTIPQGVLERSRPDSRGLLLSFLSGTAGLSFEILWTRQLTVETGGPLESFAIIISSVIGGLAIGAAFSGRHCGSGAGALRQLAMAQAAVSGFGVLCALMAPTAPLRHLVSLLGPAPGGPGFLLAQSLAGAALAFPASILLGATLPLLIASGGTSGSLGRRCGLLSSLNALGAAAGALTSGFLVLPLLGLRGSLLLTAAVSAASGALALLMARREKRIGSDDRKELDGVIRTGPVAAAPKGGRLILMTLAITGVVTTALEVIWARASSLSFGSSVQAASLVLAGVIAGLAIGNAVGARLATSSRALESVMIATLLSGSAGILIIDPLIGVLPLLAASGAPLLFPEWKTGAALISMFAQGALILLITAPACGPLGALFPIVCEHRSRRLTETRSTSRPQSQAADAGLVASILAMGSLVGAPAVLLMLGWGVGSRTCLLASSVALTAAVLMLPRIGRWHRPLGAAILFASAMTFLRPGWDPAIMSAGPFLYSPLYDAAIGRTNATPARLSAAIHARGPILRVVEGAGSYVTVRRLSDGALSMQVNGKTDASTSGDMRMQKMTAHLPLLLRQAGTSEGEFPAPTVLIVGLGSGVTLASALTHEVASVEVVEISAEVASAAELFTQANGSALDDPRAHLTIGDARSRLLFSTNGDRDLWDVIASQPSNPWVSGQAVLFTREFFAQARARLTPGGLMCQWLQGHGLDADDFRSVVATFTNTFKHAILWEESTAGGDYLLIGSDRPITIDPLRLHETMASPAIAVDLALIEITGPAQILSHIATTDAALAAFARGSTIQTEDRLALEFTAPHALRRETLSQILLGLEPHRIDPARLVETDPVLSMEISRMSSAARREREWAAALGLSFTGSINEPELAVALTYFKAGMREAALARLRSIVRRQPEERLPRMVLAHLLSEVGEARLAEAEMEAAVTLDPEDHWGWIFLARSRHAAGHTHEALSASREAELRGPMPASAWSDRCALHLSVGDLPAAEAACLEALSIAADLAEAHSNLGVARSRRGRLEEAASSFRTAIQLDPALADARHSLAAILGRTGRESEALALLQPLILESTSDAGSLRLAARLSLQAGDPASARGWLERSLKLEPGSEDAALLARDILKTGNRAGSGIRRP